jgi:hypothetical protein
MNLRKIDNVKVLGTDRKRSQIYVDTAFGKTWIPLRVRVMSSASVCKIGDCATLEVNSAWWLRHLRRDKNSVR